VFGDECGGRVGEFKAEWYNTLRRAGTRDLTFHCCMPPRPVARRQALLAITGQNVKVDVLPKRTWHAEVLDRWKCLDANGTRPTLVVRRPWVAVGKGRDEQLKPAAAL